MANLDERIAMPNAVSPESTPPVHFVRRVYFDRNTYETIYCYSMMGGFVDTTVEEDWAQIAELQENLSRKDAIDVLQWVAPDPDVEAMCAQAAWVKVRASQTDPSGYELYDATDELPEYIDPDSTLSQVLRCLHGEEELQ